MTRFAVLFAFCLLNISQTPHCVRADEPTRIAIDLASISDRANQIDVDIDGDAARGVITLRTLGTDPYFYFEIPKLPSSDRGWYLAFDYSCPDGIDGLQWRSEPSLGDPHGTRIDPLEKAEGWTTYRIDLSRVAHEADLTNRTTRARIDLGHRPGVALQIRNVHVRPSSDAEIELRRTAEERRSAKSKLAERIATYRSRTWPTKIQSVVLRGNEVVVEGKLNDPGDSNAYFVIARLGTSVAADPPSAEELQTRWELEIDEGRFSLSIPTPPDANWLSAGTRFQVYSETDRQISQSSSAVYLQPESVSDESVSPPPKLSAAKGLTCITARFSSAQIKELGLEHGSINLVVSGLLSKTARAGWRQTTINGSRWWVNEPRLLHVDRNVRTATDAGLVVAGIVLIPTSKNKRATIAHPESTSAGTYAMPNLGEPGAYELYSATMDMLAERYSGLHPEFGRIDHWIVHNEVDYAWQWTNMGEQPFEVMMDHYVRSMRLIDFCVRKYNPHAWVFISLTHRWNTDDNRHWKTYSPREMLRWLNQDVALGGDFAWGVAYHPYPQSLWKAAFWNDTEVSDDFDTRLITLKNLPVLDRFMHLPETRTSDGLIRPVICSEQGFHADENNAGQLEIQSAALLKTWKILRQCPSVIAFDYHRPSDHADEGGLRLGLRGLPSDSDPLGKAKPAWKTYSAIGTELEPKLAEHYRSVWEAPERD